MRVPNWAVNCLGRKVLLSRSFEGPVQTFPVGSVGRLESIQAGNRFAYATVVLDDDVCGGEENFRFSHLRPM
jgi:hypothetical protein